MTTLIELKHLIGCAEHGAKIEGYSVLAETWITVDDDDGVMSYSALRIAPPQLKHDQSNAWEWTGEFREYLPMEDDAVFVELISHKGSYVVYGGTRRKFGYILRQKTRTAPLCDLCGNQINADGYCDKDGWRDDEPDRYEPYTLETFPHRPMMFRWKHEPHPVLLSVFAFRANSIFGHAWGYDGTEMITPEIFLDKCEWADGSPCGAKKGSE